MSREIQVSGLLSFAKGLSRSQLSLAATLDMTGDHYQQGVQDIDDVDTEVDKGSVGTIGYVAFRNNDDSNTITVGEDGASYPIKLKPGEVAGPMRWNGAAIHAISAPYGAELEVIILED